MSTSTSPLTALTLSLTLLGVSACDSDPVLDDADAPALSEFGEPTPELDVELEAALDVDLDVVEREADLVLSLEGGAEISFFIDEDGSVGVLEAIPAGAGYASVLEDPRLKDASPAMVWHALTDDGVEIPAPLRALHEDLASQGEFEPLEQALAGQVRGISPAPLADGSPCLNSTFDTNHCDHPDYDSELCRFNASNGLTWNVHEAYRYKAGFCLQSGTARSWLYYWKGAAPFENQCTYFYVPNFVWGANSYANGDTYSATTYFSYVWWKPSTAAHRAFFHRAIGNSGAVYDFGNRYSTGGC